MATWKIPNKKITPERAIKNQIRDLCAIRGWLYFPILQGIGSMKGAPDLMIGVKGLGWIAIEVKSSKGRMSDDQLAFQMESHRRVLPHLVVMDVTRLDYWVEQELDRRHGPPR